MSCHSLGDESDEDCERLPDGGTVSPLSTAAAAMAPTAAEAVAIATTAVAANEMIKSLKIS